MRSTSFIFVLLCLLESVTVQIPAQPTSDAHPFAVRGVLPWHNFLSGPSAWNIEDYKKYLDTCKDKRINFIGFHCYTGGGQRYVTYVEPLIKISYKNILPDAYLDNSLTDRWGYEPLHVRDYAFKTSRLFSEKKAAFGSDCSVLSTSRVQHYASTQELLRNVMRLAHAWGMQTAMGFEFGVHPPEFFSLFEGGRPKMAGGPYRHAAGCICCGNCTDGEPAARLCAGGADTAFEIDRGRAKPGHS